MKKIEHSLKKYKILYFDTKNEMVSIIEKTLITKEYDVKVVTNINDLIINVQTFLPDIVFFSVSLETVKQGVEIYCRLKKEIEEKNESISLCVLCDNLIDVDTNSLDIENVLIRPINPIKILRKTNDYIQKKLANQKTNQQLNENFVFKLIIQSMPDIIIRIDELEIIRYCNFPNRYKAFFEDMNIMGKTLEETISSEIYISIKENLKLSQTNKIVKIVHCEGKNIKNEVRIIPLEDDSSVMIIRDITEQRILKSSLERFEESYTALLQSQEHIMFRMTPDLIITIVNDNFKELVNRKMVTGYHLNELLEPNQYEEVVKHLKKLSYNNRTTLFEQKIKFNDNEQIFQFIVRSIYHGENYDNRMLDEYQIIGRDITKMLAVHLDVKSDMEPKQQKTDNINSKLKAVADSAEELNDEFEQLIKRINRHNLGGG